MAGKWTGFRSGRREGQEKDFTVVSMPVFQNGFSRKVRIFWSRGQQKEGSSRHRQDSRTAQGMGVHCPLRLPETAHKARTAAGLGTSMGRSRRRDSRQGIKIPSRFATVFRMAGSASDREQRAAGYRLDTDWIQAGYRSRTGSRSRRGRGAGRGVLKNQETVAGARQGSTIDCGEGAA